ncbi:hypothetical protein PAECIP112173_03223 [Paenibacillus sp. JJ-100]|nr:hypothetical protein PAECIP112173_03223 [Paenibacillus sp. JJ-100]
MFPHEKALVIVMLHQNTVVHMDGSVFSFGVFGVAEIPTGLQSKKPLDTGIWSYTTYFLLMIQYSPHPM